MYNRYWVRLFEGERPRDIRVLKMDAIGNTENGRKSFDK